MGEFLFELIVQPIGELLSYAVGFVVVPVATLGWVRPEPLRSSEKSHNWAGLRRRPDGRLGLSHNATCLCGLVVIIGVGAAALLLIDPAAVEPCPAQALSFAITSSGIS